MKDQLIQNIFSVLFSSSQGDISVQVAVRSTAEDDNSQEINVNRVSNYYL